MCGALWLELNRPYMMSVSIDSVKGAIACDKIIQDVVKKLVGLISFFSVDILYFFFFLLFQMMVPFISTLP